MENATFVGLKDNFKDLVDDFASIIFANENIKVNIVEHPEIIKIVAQLPGGCEKNNINISFEDKILTIAGQIQTVECSPNVKVLLNEIKQINFKRSFKFNHSIDKNSIKAHLSNGLLCIQMEKNESNKGTINIPIE